MSSEKNNFIDSINTLLEDGRDDIDKISIDKKNIVLFLGASGVGKSTCINYLLGCEMEEVTDENTGVTNIRAKQEVTEIGEGIYSKTLSPKVIDVKNRSFAFCDCPGFQDNRGADYMLAGAVLMREVVQRASSVKGFVIVIDYNSIMDARHVTLNETAQNIFEMIPNYSEIKENFLFLIAKAPKEANTSQITKKLTLISNELSGSDNSTINFYFKYLVDVMLKNKDSISIINPIESKEVDIVNNRIESLAGNFNKTEIGLGLSNACKIVLSNTISKKKRMFNESLNNYYADYESYVKNKLSVYKSLCEVEFMKDELTILKKPLEHINEKDKLKDYISFSNNDLTESKEAILSDYKVLDTLMKYSSDKDAEKVNPSVITVLKKGNDSLIELCEEKYNNLVYKEDYLFLSDYEFRKELIGLDAEILYNFNNMEELNNNIKSENLKSKLKKLEEYYGLVELKKLLKLCISEAVIVTSTPEKIEKGILSLYVQYPWVLMSEILMVIHKYRIAGIHTIMVLGTGNVKMDQNFEQSEFSGKNIIITGKLLEIPKGEYHIDVSGKNGDQPAAKPGTEGANSKNGKSGKNGFNATISGDVILAFDQIKKDGNLLIKANGGNGGNGQDGGDGVIGDPGSAGVDVTFDTKGKGKYLCGEGNTFYYLYEGTQGEPGGDGGNGGDSGDAGLASKSGNIYLFGDACNLSNNASKLPGINGQPGQVGKYGGKGKGGRGGHRGIRVSVKQDYDEDTRVIDNDYFIDCHYNEGKMESDSGAGFNSIWKSNKELREACQNSKYSASGADGVQTGLEGKAGKAAKEDEMLVNPNAIDINSFLGELCTLYGFTYTKNMRNIDVLCSSGILNKVTISPKKIYPIMEYIEKTEAQVFNTSDERLFLEEAKYIYAKLEESILKAEVRNTPDWQLILFTIVQKLAYYDERLNGGNLSGNRVTVLSMLNKTIGNLLEAIEKEKKAEHQKTFFTGYQDNINNKIASGKDVMDKIRQLVAEKTDSVAKKIDKLTSEISEMKEKANTNLEALKQKKESLKNEMIFKIGLSVVTSVLDIAGSAIGIQQVFSGISQSFESLGNSLNNNERSITELQVTLDQVNFSADLNKDYFIPNISNDFDRDRKEAFKLIDINKYVTDDVSVDLVSSVYNHEHASIFQSDYDAATVKQQIASTFNVSNEKIDELVLCMKKEEIEIVKKSYSKDNSEKKLDSLNKNGEMINNQLEKLRQKNTLSKVNAALSLTNASVKCISNCISTANDYKAKIAAVEESIKKGDETIEKLDKLNQNVANFKDTIFKEKIMPFATRLPDAILKQDTFQLEYSNLEIKKMFNELINKFTGIDFSASSEIADLFKEIKDMLETQITIADKIEAQKSQLEMGSLIYNLSSTDDYSWSEEQLKLINRVKTNKLQYLSQLEMNAYLLWAFPFGDEGLKLSSTKTEPYKFDDEKAALQKAKIQNEAIANWLERKGYTWLETDSIVSLHPMAGSLKKKVGKISNTYATIKFDGTQCSTLDAERFLTGEKITVELPINYNYDVIKYITIFAHIPKLIDNQNKIKLDDDTKVTMQFSGDGYYSISNDSTSTTNVYKFHQDDIRISHGIQLEMKEGNTPDVIWSTINDAGIDKFMKAGIDSGRSPYSKVTISLSRNSWKKKLSFDELNDKQKELFKHYFSDPKSETKIVNDLKTIGWISEKKQIIEKWSMISKSDELLKRGYNIDSAELIKDIILTQSLIADRSIIEGLEIELIGYAVYLDRDILNSRNYISHLYDRFIIKTVNMN